MATPHSLPSTPHRAGTQLPFSPAQSNAMRRSSIGAARPDSSGNGSTTSPPPSRPGSTVSTTSRPPNTVNAGETTVPLSLSLPSFQHRHTHSASHATGILPSASFFHPSRPSYPPPSPSSPHMRRSSVGSVVSTEAPHVDAVRLTTLSERHSNASEGSESVDHSGDDVKGNRTTPGSAKSPTVKPSREPLLPIGPGPKPPRRPSLNTQTLPYGMHDGSMSPAGRVRGSFEKLFKRGLSTDGSKPSPVNKSPTSPLGTSIHTDSHSRAGGTSPISSSPAARMTFDLSVQTRRKRSPSPLPSSASTTPSLKYIPTPPPKSGPPLEYTPIVDATTGKPKHNWQLHPSRNRFFLNGRILTGGDTPWAFISALTVIFGITGVWFGTTCVWWWWHESPAVAIIGAYMCLLTISSMCATAFRDPGILPRNLDPDPPFTMLSTESVQAPLPRDIRVRAGVVRTKYCKTCRTYRPPRSSHCKMCDNCVDGCDHHCQWVNNCVGRRNYTAFFTFLFTAVFTLIMVICTSAIHLYLLTRAPFKLDFRHALQTPQGAGSATVFMLSVLVIWPVLALLVYHLRLLVLNVTTIEQIRNQAHKSLVPGPAPPNPFSHGSWRRNAWYVLCRPPGFSGVDAAAIATEDRREVNPGLLRDAEGGSEVGWNAVMSTGTTKTQ